jgi:ActR/RegA family two-component response regulator
MTGIEQPLAKLISPAGETFVAAENPNVGFRMSEISCLIGGDGKAFLLQSGGSLIIHSLFCRATLEEQNLAATQALRHARCDPGGEVSGCALLLDRDETDRLSSPVKGSLSLDGESACRTVLLLDDDDGVRPVIALGFERHRCRVIQARAFDECLSFCRNGRIDVFVSDLGCLRPNPLVLVQSIGTVQPDAQMLLISGHDDLTIKECYPGLLDELQFLKKPVGLRVLDQVLAGLTKKDAAISYD